MPKNNCYDCEWCKVEQFPEPPDHHTIPYVCKKGKKEEEMPNCNEFEPKSKTP